MGARLPLSTREGNGVLRDQREIVDGASVEGKRSFARTRIKFERAGCSLPTNLSAPSKDVFWSGVHSDRRAVSHLCRISAKPTELHAASQWIGAIIALIHAGLCDC